MGSDVSGDNFELGECCSNPMDQSGTTISRLRSWNVSDENTGRDRDKAESQRDTPLVTGDLCDSEEAPPTNTMRTLPPISANHHWCQDPSESESGGRTNEDDHNEIPIPEDALKMLSSAWSVFFEPVFFVSVGDITVIVILLSHVRLSSCP